MRLSVQEFWVPKRGNPVEEYEDAFSHSLAEGRFAVADGATESAFADRWARSLVKKFIAHPPFASAASASELPQWLEPLQLEWQEAIDWNHLPWFAEIKARSGAFSTIVGLEFSKAGMGEPAAEPAQSSGLPLDGLRWHALAIGDSCLFQVRDGRLFESFPLCRAVEFNSRPVLVSSNPTSNERVWEEVYYKEGDTQPEDLFFLATDALSQWFLAEHESGGKPWEMLCELKTNDEFVSFIAQLREDHRLRNDDTTLLTVRLDGCGAMAGEQEDEQPDQESHEDGLACSADRDTEAGSESNGNVP